MQLLYYYVCMHTLVCIHTMNTTRAHIHTRVLLLETSGVTLVVVCTPSTSVCIQNVSA